MSLDTNNFIIAGTMQQQNSSVFTLSSLAGSYIITLNGRNASAPTSALGEITLASNGATSNVSFDRRIAGVGTAGPTTGASAAVTFAAAGPDTNGRSTLSVTLNDALTSGTQNFVYYAITANRCFFPLVFRGSALAAILIGPRNPVGSPKIRLKRWRWSLEIEVGQTLVEGYQELIRLVQETSPPRTGSS